MDDIDLRMILEILKCRNLTKASESMNISQPALSKRLRNLESTLGIQLFTRTKTGIEFTKNGTRFLEFAQTTISNYEEMLEHFRSVSTGRRTLEIISVTVFSQKVLPTIANEFCKIHQDIRLKVQNSITSDIKGILDRNPLPLAFIRGPGSIDGYWKIRIGSDPLVLISKDPLEESDAVNHPMVTYPLGSSLEKQIDDWRVSKWGDCEFNEVITVGDSQSCITCVSKGLGIAVVPYYVLYGWEKQGLYIIPITDQNGNRIYRESFLHFNEEQYRSNEDVRAFVDFVEHFFSIEENQKQHFPLDHTEA